MERTPERGTGTPSGKRDADLARCLMAVSELMVESDDIHAVYARLLTDCVRLLGVAAAGLLLVDEHGLTPVSTIGASAHVLTALEQTTGVGPAIEASRSGDDSDVLLEEARLRWPPFAAAAEALGVGRVTTMPVCLVEEPVGALELHLEGRSPLAPLDQQVAKTFAGLAAVVVHHQNELQRSSTRVRQLETALQTRVVVEQAKGFLVAKGMSSPEAAFEAMRSYARPAGLRVYDVAQDVLTGRLDVSTLHPR